MKIDSNNFLYNKIIKFFKFNYEEYGTYRTFKIYSYYSKCFYKKSDISLFYNIKLKY